MKKVGIMGGTFNPIHLGHLILAETAYYSLKLDEVLFMPSKNPPHKKNIDILSDDIRAAMVKCAIEDNSHFKYSDIELKRDGTTYTADTLTYLKKGHTDSEYFFMMGADSFFDVEKWYKPEIILDISQIVVAVRDNISMESLQKHAQNLKEKYNARIHLINMPNIDISSSAIRQSILKDNFVKYYVPSEVYKYIKKKRLYI